MLEWSFGLCREEAFAWMRWVFRTIHELGVVRLVPLKWMVKCGHYPTTQTRESISRWRQSISEKQTISREKTVETGHSRNSQVQSSPLLLVFARILRHLSQHCSQRSIRLSPRSSVHRPGANTSIDIYTTIYGQEKMQLEHYPNAHNSQFPPSR